MGRPDDYGGLNDGQQESLAALQDEVRRGFDAGNFKVDFDVNDEENRNIEYVVWEAFVEEANRNGFSAMLRGANCCIERPRSERPTGRQRLQLSDNEQEQVRRLLKEIETHFLETPERAYVFDPFSIGAGDFNTRVKTEACMEARRAGFNVSSFDGDGGFTVAKRR